MINSCGYLTVGYESMGFSTMRCPILACSFKWHLGSRHSVPVGVVVFCCLLRLAAIWVYLFCGGELASAAFNLLTSCFSYDFLTLGGPCFGVRKLDPDLRTPPLPATVGGRRGGHTFWTGFWAWNWGRQVVAVWFARWLRPLPFVWALILCETTA